MYAGALEALDQRRHVRGDHGQRDQALEAPTSLAGTIRSVPPRPPEHGARPAIDLDIREPEEAPEGGRGLLGRSAADDDALESHRGLHRGLRGHRGGELDQHAMASARMQKRNAPGQPITRSTSSSGDALAPERGEILIDTRGLEAQVMQSLAPLREEARDSGVGGRRLEQLDLAVAGGESAARTP